MKMSAQKDLHPGKKKSTIMKKIYRSTTISLDLVQGLTYNFINHRKLTLWNYRNQLFLNYDE